MSKFKAAIAPHLALVALLLCSGLAACSGSNQNTGSSASQDQGGGSASGSANATAGRRRFAQVLMSLDLSDDQKAKIRAMRDDLKKQNAGADPETRRANFRTFIANIQTVLTPDQRATFKAKMAEMRGPGAPQTAPTQS